MMSVAAQASRIFLILSFVLGVGYPLLVTAVGQFFFPKESNGSLIMRDGQVIASELLAQKIESSRLFWPRPSASDYGAIPSGASNQGPTSEALKSTIADRKARGLTHEMLFASGSGLDPHISADAAIGQLPRIVESRNLGDNENQEIQDLIQTSIEKRDFGFLGEERINVLKLNAKLIEKFGK